MYLVEDIGNNPGRIYAVMADELDAKQFADQLEAVAFHVDVVERHLWYGQPSNRGMNK